MGGASRHPLSPLEPASHAVAAAALLAYVAWAWILSGWGLNTSDVIFLFSSPMLVAALLALPPAVRLWRAGRTRVLAAVTVLLLAGASVALVGPIMAGWPGNPRSPWWLIFPFLGYHLVARLGLAAPLLVGLDTGSRPLQVAGLTVFLLGTIASSLGLVLVDQGTIGIGSLWLPIEALLVAFALLLAWSAWRLHTRR